MVILQATFNPGGMDTLAFKEYSRRSNANGEAHGGVVANKFKVVENLADGDCPHMILVVHYSSREKARQAFSSKEYKDILPLRDVAFKDVKILLVEA